MLKIFTLLAALSITINTLAASAQKNPSAGIIAGIQAGENDRQDYFKRENNVAQWNQFNENLQKIQQYKAKREQLQTLQDSLNQKATKIESDLNADQTLAQRYRLAALSINPTTLEINQSLQILSTCTNSLRGCCSSHRGINSVSGDAIVCNDGQFSPSCTCY